MGTKAANFEEKQWTKHTNGKKMREEKIAASMYSPTEHYPDFGNTKMIFFLH